METPGNANDPDMHEGQRLYKALTKAGKKPIDLTRACGVSKGAATRWFKMEVLGRNMWQTIRPGLKKLGIEPTTIKPDDPQSEEDIDLVSDLDAAGFSQEQLAVIQRVLLAHPGDQKPVLWWLRGMIRKKLQ